MDERNTGSFHLTGAGQSGGVSARTFGFSVETATVYRGGGRRWFSEKAAVRAEAAAIIKRKYPSERADLKCGGGFHWRELPRSDDLFRRVCRIVRAASKAERSAEPTRAGTERHTRNEPDPESGIRISPGSSIPVERGMV